LWPISKAPTTDAQTGCGSVIETEVTMRKLTLFRACGSAALAAAAAFSSLPALAQQSALVGDGMKPGQRIEIRDLKRDDGGTVTLRFQFINDSEKDVIDACSYREINGETCGVVSGVNLIDAANKKKYLVVRDAQRNCVCATGLPHLGKGDRMNAWAKFQAPPDGVQKVTVVVPGFEPVEAVPITSR
jgi:hypothetical protein